MTIQEFANLLESSQKAYLKQHSLDCEANMKAAETRIVPGNKYTKIDVGSSGKYMIVNETSEIYGIKAYGVIHKGHYYGTLETVDQYDWKGYTAVKKR